MMSDTTGCAVASGTDGLSLHFGAFTDEKIRQAKLKMDNMLKYHVSYTKSQEESRSSKLTPL